jgi:hypothetical protein
VNQTALLGAGAVAPDGGAVHRAGGDLPAVPVDRVRLGPAGPGPARRPHVPDLLRGAVAVEDQRTAGGVDRRGVAAVADRGVHHLRAVVLHPVGDEGGADRHGLAAGGRPTVEPERAHALALRDQGDEAVLGGRAVVVEEAQGLPGGAPVGRAGEVDAVGVGALTELGQPPGVERGVQARAALRPIPALDHSGAVGPVGEELRGRALVGGARSDGDRLRPAVGAEACEAQAPVATPLWRAVAGALEPGEGRVAGDQGELRSRGAGGRGGRNLLDRRRPLLPRPTAVATRGGLIRPGSAGREGQEQGREGRPTGGPAGVGAKPQ